MARTNNYLIQAQQARELFLQYDQEQLIQKLHLNWDDSYLYPVFMGQKYRIHRKNGDISRWEDSQWLDANSFEESLTLLDLVCDSKENRFLSGKLKIMQEFGLQFHQNLLEDVPNPFANAIQSDPERFSTACEALGGIRVNYADIAYSFDVFDGLPLVIFFWEGDEEFAPRIRYYWDENAKMYIRYETMYYAVNLLTDRIQKRMHEKLGC